jgi:aspartate/methionine/tyrosine aminotransferase
MDAGNQRIVTVETYGVCDSRPFCTRAAERGVLLAPGDCFGFPQHFRMGFGACDDGFDEALGILSAVLKEMA